MVMYFLGVCHHRIAQVVILVILLRSPIPLKDGGTSTAVSGDPSDRLHVEHLLNRRAIRGLWGEHPLDDVVERVEVFRVDHEMGRVLKLDALRSAKQIAGIMSRRGCEVEGEVLPAVVCIKACLAGCVFTLRERRDSSRGVKIPNDGHSCRISDESIGFAPSQRTCRDSREVAFSQC